MVGELIDLISGIAMGEPGDKAKDCQSALKIDPRSASNRDPSASLVQACPGSEQEGPARSGVTATSPT
jgi:hypothetical protein